jgi:DNA-binding LytR/AlgR family response regulator
MTPTALIAEDEPLLRHAMEQALAEAWPELQVVARVGDGLSAVQAALEQRPQVLFLDIRMPGLDGLEVAAELSDAWPENTPFPALVFVTAYDQYAIKAFEAEALDYLLKPVQPQRLTRTVHRLQERLACTAPSAAHAVPEALLSQLRHVLEQAHTMPTASTTPLQVIQASVGQALHMVPVDDVLVFEAADKYVRVLTAEREYLIRTPLKELLPRLPPDAFWQVHRGTLVRAGAVEQVVRDDAGKLHLRMKGRPERWAVSRLYAYRFKAM